MTDEEKAEEYTDSINTIIYDIEDNPINIARCLRKAYLDGLAESRKEQENKDKGFCESFCMKGGKIALLEKENAELKEELSQKSDTNHSLVEQLADKEIIISELKEQIEKMKCCGNCKHNSKSKMYKNPCRKCFELCCWELAE